MDMSLCADCGDDAQSIALLAMHLGALIVCFAVGAGTALLAAALSRAANISLVAMALLLGLGIAIALAALGVRPALLFPITFLTGEALAVHRLYRRPA